MFLSACETSIEFGAARKGKRLDQRNTLLEALIYIRWI